VAYRPFRFVRLRLIDVEGESQRQIGHHLIHRTIRVDVG